MDESAPNLPVRELIETFEAMSLSVESLEDFKNLRTQIEEASLSCGHLHLIKKEVWFYKHLGKLKIELGDILSGRTLMIDTASPIGS